MSVRESYPDSMGQGTIVRSRSVICARASIRCAILVDEDATPSIFALHGDEIIIGIGCAVAGRAIADLEIDDVLVPVIDEMMPVPGSRLEPRAHAGLQLCLTFVRDQDRMTVDDVDELILLGMRMTERRHRPRFQGGEIHAEDGQPEEITQRALDAPSDT